MGRIPVGMEMFNAADEEQWAVITRTIDQCDYYVVIVAHRYGSTTPDDISFTEKEYDYAVTQGIPVLGFIIAEDAPWPNTVKDERPDALKALKRFKAKVKQKMVRFWHTAPELRSQFVESLATTINVNPRRGWVRAPEGADIAQALSNLTEENARLRLALNESKQPPSAKGNIDEIADIISAQILKPDNQQVDGITFVVELIQFMRNDPFGKAFFSVSEIVDEFRECDSRRIKSLINELHILGMLQRNYLDEYGLTDISSQVYAKLVLRKNVS